MPRMRVTVHSALQILKQTFREFWDDGCPAMAAALAYYTAFSLPPLLVLVILMAQPLVGTEALRQQIVEGADHLIGSDAAAQVAAILQSADLPAGEGTAATLFSLGALLLSATAAFGQLQRALNVAWNVMPDKSRGGIRSFLLKRALSFAMVLIIALLVLMLVILSTGLSAMGAVLGELLPGRLSEGVLRLFHLTLSLTLVTTLFAAIYKILPDARIGWRNVWAGAALTTLLFVFGEVIIGLYLGRSEVGSAYGAARSLAVILAWIYYSSMILLLGAELTQVLVRRDGRNVQPEKNAVYMSERVQKVP